MNERKVCFLDRDGTIIRDMHYLNSVQDIFIYKSAIRGLLLLKKLGFEFVVLSNQSGIEKGLTSFAMQDLINIEINKKLLMNKLEIKEFLYCPHSPKIGCVCRKPKPGLIKRHVDRYGKLDQKSSILIGDRVSDVETALNYGIIPFHVLTGKGLQEKMQVRSLGVRSRRNIHSIANLLLGNTL